MSTSLLKKTLELLESGSGSQENNSQRVNTKQKGSKSKISKHKLLRRSRWNPISVTDRQTNEANLVENNLKLLKLLSSGHVDDETSSKILIRAGKTKAEETKSIEDEKTVFTEEDFLAFEKEYFVSG